MKHSGPYQPRLVHEQPILYLPASGAVVTGRGLGPDWDMAVGATVTHVTPSSGFTTQFRRTRFTSAAAVADQELGVHLPNAADASIWRGNVDTGPNPDVYYGGFYFSTRFMVNAIPDTDVRFFAGLSNQVVGVCVSDTVAGHCVGLWCASTHATDLKLLTMDGTTATATDLTTDADLTAGTLYEFVMIGNPGGSSIVTQLLNVGLGTVLNEQNINTTMPSETTFMAPQVGLSNAANVVGGDTSLDIISIYARPRLRLAPEGLG